MIQYEFSEMNGIQEVSGSIPLISTKIVPILPLNKVRSELFYVLRHMHTRFSNKLSNKGSSRDFSNSIF